MNCKYIFPFHINVSQYPFIGRRPQFYISFHSIVRILGYQRHVQKSRNSGRCRFHLAFS
jgi:hypothetical protein